MLFGFFAFLSNASLESSFGLCKALEVQHRKGGFSTAQREGEAPAEPP